jgi:hypothetical protein
MINVDLLVPKHASLGSSVFHLTSAFTGPSVKITHLHELLPGNWKPELGSAG